MDRDKRIWYLSLMRAAQVQASLCIRAVLPEPPLLAHTSSESRGTFRQKAGSLAPLNGWACAFKICHDGMLEDTNSLDAVHTIITHLNLHKILTIRRACASAQSCQNLRYLLIQAVSQEEPSDRKPDPWPLWMAGHAHLKFVMTECSKTQIRLTRSIRSSHIWISTKSWQSENHEIKNVENEVIYSRVNWAVKPIMKWVATLQNQQNDLCA